MSAEHTFPLIRVAGNAYELGYQHGAQAAGLIRRYLLLLERVTRMPRDGLCRNAGRFVPLIEAFIPAYMEQVRGLAAGAQISFEEAMLCQARAEAAYQFAKGCSAFALSGAATQDGQTLAGQNQDLPPEYGDVALMLQVVPHDGRPRALIFTFAGQLGYAGIDQHGLALFANALYNYQWQLGLPKCGMPRTILRRQTVAQARERLLQHRLCSANNLVLADAGGHIADIEIWPEGVAEYADDHPDRRVHTNNM
jgi:isopenicillin-N N-acyltransferase-like protein